MRVKGYNVELHSFVDGRRRHVATYGLAKTRNCFRKLTQTLELAAKNFDGFVAVVIMPVIDEQTTEVKNEQGEQTAPAASAGEAVGRELSKDIQASIASAAQEGGAPPVVAADPDGVLPGLPE